MVQLPEPEVWGLSRLRPRSMPLHLRSEGELFTTTTEALRPRSAGQCYTRQYLLDPESSPTLAPEREAPRGPDETAGYSAGVGEIITAYVQAYWTTAQ